MIADAMLRADADSVLIAVRVVPRASRAEIVGERDGRLLIRVTAPPVEGRANDAVRRLVAKAAGVGLSHVRVVRGERARDKTLRVDGASVDDVARRLR
jgi:uncharacterized protein (TIGR00251 family)